MGWWVPTGGYIERYCCYARNARPLHLLRAFDFLIGDRRLQFSRLAVANCFCCAKCHPNRTYPEVRYSLVRQKMRLWRCYVTFLRCTYINAAQSATRAYELILIMYPVQLQTVDYRPVAFAPVIWRPHSRTSTSTAPPKSNSVSPTARNEHVMSCGSVPMHPSWNSFTTASEMLPNQTIAAHAREYRVLL